jgi:hypothetical protein
MGIDTHWPWGNRGNGWAEIQGQGGGGVKSGGVVVLMEGTGVARCWRWGIEGTFGGGK